MIVLPKLGAVDHRGRTLRQCRDALTEARYSVVLCCCLYIARAVEAIEAVGSIAGAFSRDMDEIHRGIGTQNRLAAKIPSAFIVACRSRENTTRYSKRVSSRNLRNGKS